MQYISKEQVRQYPLRYENGRIDEDNANVHFLCGVESVIDYVDYLPTVDISDKYAKDEWRTDCKPDDKQEVLVTVVDEFGRTSIKAVIYFEDGDEYWDEGKLTPCQVLAWMPQPMPYRAEGKHE